MIGGSQRLNQVCGLLDFGEVSRRMGCRERIYSHVKIHKSRTSTTFYLSAEYTYDTRKCVLRAVGDVQHNIASFTAEQPRLRTVTYCCPTHEVTYALHSDATHSCCPTCPHASCVSYIYSAW